MTPEQRAALTNPLSSSDLEHLKRCRQIHQSGDVITMVILAVDR